MIQLEKIITNAGNDLKQLSTSFPVLLVFLRHFGCLFCQEALRDISERKDQLSYNKIKVVFVHMAENEVANEFFEKYSLSGYEHISDPECKLYNTFGLGKGSFSQLFGLSTWIRGYQISRSKRHHMAGKVIGDSFQMPGIFLLNKGEIIDSYIHKSASDRPDYEKFINCCSA